MFQGESRSLQYGANDHNNGAKEDDAATTKPVANENGDDGTNKAAQVVRSHSDALISGTPGSLCRVLVRLGVDGRELVQKDG